MGGLQSIRNVCWEFGEFNINHVLREIHRPIYVQNIRADITFLISGIIPSISVEIFSSLGTFWCQQRPVPFPSVLPCPVPMMMMITTILIISSTGKYSEHL